MADSQLKGSGRWHVETVVGSVAQLHELDPPEVPAATVWLMQPTDTALVLGSGQRDVAVDAMGLEAQSLEVVRRRSGGGAVIIDQRTDWIDVWIPRDGPLWAEDLGETFLTIGTAWAQAFGVLHIDVELCRERPVRSPISDAVCFAGMGWGEVSIGGAKVVGLSQRRTRWGARVQCLAVCADHTRAAAALLGIDPTLLPRELPGANYDLAQLQAAFLTQLTSA